MLKKLVSNDEALFKHTQPPQKDISLCTNRAAGCVSVCDVVAIFGLAQVQILLFWEARKHTHTNTHSSDN